MRFGVMTQTTKLEIQYRKHMKNNSFKHYVQLLKIKRIQKTCKNNQEYATARRTSQLDNKKLLSCEKIGTKFD